jgi:altronate hydrolase
MLITLQDTPALRLHPDDDVAIALVPLSANRRIEVAGQTLRMNADVAAGHKLALRGIETGQPLRRYGQVIGFATRPIAPGDFVHSHNLAVGEMQLDYQFGTDIRPIDMVAPAERRTFMGYRRTDGRAGTRNTIAIIGTVNCSAHTLRQIAARARAELLPKFPNVTDVVGLAHKNGCASATSGHEIELLRRTLAGFAHHPNVAGYLFVGLGCEANQFEALLESQRDRLGDPRLPPYIAIQDSGGVQATIEAEAREQAEALASAAAEAVAQEANVSPQILVRSGKPAEVVREVIGASDEIAALVLATAPSGAPGPLVAYFTGHDAGTLPCPVMLVPGGIDIDRLDALS